MHTQKMVEFHPFAIKILRGNKLLASIKSHNSFINMRKITGNNLININAFTKFGPILSIHSEHIERKRNSDTNEGP